MVSTVGEQEGANKLGGMNSAYKVTCAHVNAEAMVSVSVH